MSQDIYYLYVPIKVATLATRHDDLFTDDTSQITESDSEWFFWNTTTSNYFCNFQIFTNNT